MFTSLFTFLLFLDVSGYTQPSSVPFFTLHKLTFPKPLRSIATDEIRYVISSVAMYLSGFVNVNLELRKD